VFVHNGYWDVLIGDYAYENQVFMYFSTSGSNDKRQFLLSPGSNDNRFLEFLKMKESFKKDFRIY